MPFNRWFQLVCAVLTLATAAGCQHSRSSTSTAGATVEAAPSAPPPAPPPASKPAAIDSAVVAPVPTPPPGEGWRRLFDGQTLTGWKVTDFAGHGDVRVEKGTILMEMGAALTGVTWTNDFPKKNYEAAWEAMKVDGSDFFAATTMPVGDAHFTFVIGGWGGGVVGLSSLNGQDASENETTKFMSFARNRWYRFRARVTLERIQCWIDDERIIDQDITETTVALRVGEIDLNIPFGMAAWQTTGAIRSVYVRALPASP